MNRDKKLIPFGIKDPQKIPGNAVDRPLYQTVVDPDPVIDMDDIIAFFQVGVIFFRCVDGFRVAFRGTGRSQPKISLSVMT